MARPSRQPLDAAEARNFALRALSRREHSANELLQKLAAQGFEQDQATELVAELQHAGWQSDARYAELLIRSRVSQGYGPLRLTAELGARGVDPATIRDALTEADCDWTALALQLHRKRFGALPAGAAEGQKQHRYLAGRGFDAAQIRAVLKGQAPDEFD